MDIIWIAAVAVLWIATVGLVAGLHRLGGSQEEQP